MRHSFRYVFIFLCSLAFCATNLYAVSLPNIFGDHMVLQQNQSVKLWGWGKPQEEIMVTCSWQKEPIKTVADHLANWNILLATPAAGGPYRITIQGYNEVVIEDILIGEVWLCSGQSNMEWTPRATINNAEEEIANANFPEIRFFKVEHKTADAPQINLEGQWQVCTPQTMIDFSAAAYFFSRDLHTQLSVPVGLILSAWGGTPAEIWTNPQVIEQDEQLLRGAGRLVQEPWGPKDPGKAYHTMIAPITGFRIAGVLWYQGETNVASPLTYTHLLRSLINNWRTEWGYDFPFYYAQIAPYQYGKPLEGVLLRDAQRQCMTTPNTGMVVTSDIGNITDIHPKNKQELGRRFALWALHNTYGKTDLECAGPMYKSMQVEGKKIRLTFDYADNGLVCKGSQLTHFQIAGDDQVFMAATAEIDGNSVVVFSKKVKNPVAVRFAWSNTAEPNLFNSAGLPASCFRTDDWVIAGFED